ncbi:MAG: hypothetical protein JXA94_00575 [Parachlamydiales bacterium]|nr:hypothetical protein [Parachlamydiales bacterium]
MSANARVIKDPDVVNYSHFGAGNTYNIASKEKDNTKLFGANSSNNSGDNEDITTGDIILALRGLMLTFVGTSLTLSLMLGDQNNTMCNFGIEGAQANGAAKSAAATGAMWAGGIGCLLGGVALGSGIFGGVTAAAEAADMYENVLSVPTEETNLTDLAGAGGEGQLTGAAGGEDMEMEMKEIQHSSEPEPETEQVGEEDVAPKDTQGAAKEEETEGEKAESTRDAKTKELSSKKPFKNQQERDKAKAEVEKKYFKRKDISNKIASTAAPLSQSAPQLASAPYQQISSAKETESGVLNTYNQTEGTNLKFTENNVNSASQNQNAAAQVVDHVNSAKIASSSNIR